MADLFGEDIRQAELMGGEPLLHPSINEILQIARSHLNGSQIVILTNGIKLPDMPESFWESCVAYKIKIRITKYPIKINHEAIAEKAKKMGVEFDIFNNPDIEKTSYHIPLDLDGKQDERANFMRCFHANSNCFLLREFIHLFCRAVRRHFF